MSSSAAQALALAYALEIGAADMVEARKWADVQITATPNPSDAILALATEHNVAEAVSLLHELGRNARREEVGKLVYGWMLRAIRNGSLSHERGAEAIVRLARDSIAPSPEAHDQSWHFDDAFYLARHKMYGTVTDVSAEVEEHLRQFAE